MDLARAPRRAARKKGSGYENGTDPITLPRFVFRFASREQIRLVENGL
jgi:hypothetical protein